MSVLIHTITERRLRAEPGNPPAGAWLKHNSASVGKQNVTRGTARFAARVSRRRPAAGNLADFGVIAGGHASDIAPEIFVALSGIT